MTLRIRIQKTKDAPDLKKASVGSSGFDLSSLEDFWIHPGEVRRVPVGYKFEIPLGCEAQIRSRSGLSSKGIVVANSPGTIDSDYRGEVCVLLQNLSSGDVHINYGDRIAQLVICPVPQVEFEYVKELSDTSRGEGGFGSTGI